MILGILACVSLALGNAESSYLAVNNDVYVPMPATYLARYGVAVTWSQDSRCVVYQSGDSTLKYTSVRQGIIARGDYSVDNPDVSRYDVLTGRVQLLLSAQPDEFFGEIALIGPGSDALFVVRRVTSDGILQGKLFFAPSGQAATSVSDWSEAKSTSLICSPKAKVGFYAVQSSSGLQLFRLSDGSIRQLPLPSSWDSGTFSGNTTDGGAILAVLKKTDGNAYMSDVLRVDYETGIVTASEKQPFELQRERTGSLFATKGNPIVASNSPAESEALVNIELSDRSSTTRRLIFAHGVTTTHEFSPDGLKLAYRTPEGFFVRELVKVSEAAAKKKLAGG